MDKILSVFGLDHNNIFGIVKLCMELSVKNGGWIMPEGFCGESRGQQLLPNPAASKNDRRVTLELISPSHRRNREQQKQAKSQKMHNNFIKT